MIGRARGCGAVLSTLWAGAALCGPSAAAAGDGLLPGDGGGRYTIGLETSSEVGGDTLLQTRAHIELQALEPGKWRVRLLGGEQMDRLAYEWKDMLIDSVDPRTDGLPEGVELEFVVDGPPDMQTLFPKDIPSAAFGLLLEATTLLSICSEVSGLDQLHEPGDEARFEGFQLAWSLPHGSPANRRTVLPGTTRFVGVEDGRRIVEVRPEGALWSTIYGYADDLRLSVGVEEFTVELRFDAETGELRRAEIPWTKLQIRPIGEVDAPVIPERDAIDIPEDATTYVTRRRIVLEKSAPDEE